MAWTDAVDHSIRDAEFGSGFETKAEFIEIATAHYCDRVADHTIHGGPRNHVPKAKREFGTHYLENHDGAALLAE